MKWFKRLVLALVAVVLVFVVAAIVFVLTVNPNDYKSLIIEEVHKATGRTLTLDGNIQLSLFPWLGLELGSASLSNPTGFGDQPFASVENAEIRVAVLPLLKGAVQADTLKLAGLSTNLIRDQAGKTNWDDLTAEKGTQTDTKTQPDGDVTPPMALAIGGIEIESASIHWKDDQNGSEFRIAPINIKTGAIAPGSPFSLSVDARGTTPHPPITTDLELTGTVTLDIASQIYRVSDMDLHAKSKGPEIPSGKVDAALKTNVDADLGAGTITLQPLELNTLGMALNGQVRVTDLNAKPMLRAAFASQPFSPRDLLAALGQSPLKTTDPDVLTRASLSLTLEADAEQTRLTELKATLDDSTLEGTGSVSTYGAPRIAFDLALDQIDADRYLPPPAANNTPHTADSGNNGTASSGSQDLGLPMEALRGLNVDGTVAIDALKISNLRLSKTRVVLQAKDGVLKIKPAETALYDGRLLSNLTLDVRTRTPGMAAVADLTEVQIGELTEDLLQSPAYLNGLANLSIQVTTAGNSVPALKRGLAGKASLDVGKGALRDPELARKVEAVVAFLNRRQPQPATDAIIFDSLKGSARIDRGVANNQDLELITPLILAKGAGTVDIGADTVDYTLRVGLAGGKKDDKQILVPITLKGPFNDLRYGLDLEDVAKERVKDELQKKLEEDGGKLQEKLEDKLKGKIKLF